MQMAAGLDTGPVLLSVSTPIGARESSGTLLQRLTEIGASAIVDALGRLDALRPEPQDDARATYAGKVSKVDARIDWGQPAAYIDRQIRAFDPTPGAEALLNGEPVKVWRAEPLDVRGLPGQILGIEGDGLQVGCGDGALRLLEVQRPGGRRMAATEFWRGQRLVSAVRKP